MKKIIFSLAMLSLLAACGGGADKKEEKKETTTDITENPDYKKGLELIANSDCLN